MLSIPVQTQEPVTFGEVILGIHDPGLTWTLVGASLVSKPSEMTLVGVGGLPGSKDTTQRGFPPVGMQTLPLRINGAGSVALGVAATATGLYTSPGVRVEYEVGPTKYEVVVQAGIRLCVNVPCP